MIITDKDNVSKEILEFLRSKLELPEEVIGLTLHMRVNSIISIECEYYPRKKEPDG